MNLFRLPVFSAVALQILFLLLGIQPRALGSAEDQINQAIAVSQNWVHEIDQGKYDESYSFGCQAMREKVPSDRWSIILKTLRTPWGSVVSRKQLSHIYKPNGVPDLPGECMVITYDTSFKSLDPAMEIVVLRWEDGKWRGAGYTAGPKAALDGSANPSEPAASPTEIHTDPHVQAQPQQ